MPVELNVTIDDQGVKDLLVRLQKRFDKLWPIMNVIGEIVQSSIQRNFEAGGRPTKWQDLSETTKARRTEKKKWPGQILVVSGGLKAISYQADDDSVTLTNRKKYAAVQHFGAKRGSFGTVVAQIKEHVRKIGEKSVTVSAHIRKMTLPWGDIPARPFMLVQNEDWTEIKAQLTEFLFA